MENARVGRRNGARCGRRCGRLAAAALAAGLLCATLPDPALAQQVRGTVVEAETGTAVAGAAVRLLRPEGKLVEVAETDSVGRFLLAPEKGGSYRVQVERIGYAPMQRDVRIKGGEELRLELTVKPVEVGAVVVQLPRGAAEAHLRQLGLDPRAFGGYLVTADRIDRRAASAHDFGDLLRDENIPGLRVREVMLHPYDTMPSGLCVELTRNARSQNCAPVQVYVDDSLLGNPLLALGMLPPGSVESIILLRPSEAAVLFGPNSVRGVLLVYMKH